MDLWTFQRFQRPLLCVESIEHEKGRATVRLHSGANIYRLAFDDDEAAAQLAADLGTLRHSDAPLWTLLRDSAPESPWFSLGAFLDTHSLIAEGRDDAIYQLTAQRERVQAVVASTRAVLLSGLAPERRAILSKHATMMRQALLLPFGLDPELFDPAKQPNFFLALLTLEFEYFRRFSPLTLAAADLLLSSLVEESETIDCLRDDVSDVAGLYDERDLLAHLWLVGCSLVCSTGEDAVRMPTASIPEVRLASGLEFMRQTELLTRETLLGWGENPYVTAVDALGGKYSPLVAGPFIEQYHVTRRFVEIIAPLLSTRLAKPLRSIAFRYYSEEYGHEALESTTCEALGVAEATLEKVVPLPLHFAFVDMLTLFADVDPITSFAAVMTIEGIFGEPPKMSLRLVAAARENAAFRAVASEHDELNESLNHNSISRNLFEQLLAVSPGRQIATMRRILFLLELNHRAWGDIADFYGAQERLTLQGVFGQSLAPRG